MVIKRILPILFLLTALSLSGRESLKEQMNLIYQSIPLKAEANNHHSFFSIKKETSEWKIFLLYAFGFYKNFISSQDNSVCIFAQSCSAFSMEAIRRFGILQGLLITSDRLLRCHGPGMSQYPIDQTKRKAIDYPIEYYALKKINTYQ